MKTRKASRFLIAAVLLVAMFWLSGAGTAQTPEMAGLKPSKTFMLTKKMIEDRIKMFLLKEYSQNHDEIRIEVSQVPDAIEVDPVDWEVKVESRSGTVRNGVNSLDVTVFSSKEIYKKFVASARLRTFDDVVVAARLINRGEQLKAEDLKLERVETTNFKRDYFTDLSELIGLQAKQVIAAEKPIFAGMVELPDLIHRGDVVRIVVQLKNLKVTAMGKALENGKKGEKIRVQNLSTGKKLTGTIVDEKTVVVEL
ncbi:MAG TPA: flagellar basal body P-ring formation protein FlgA [Bacteroidetes bacterium]|nr:flagellar basal body P-ring formation protein FlgA [Bacteroidota bacterium]